MNDTKPDIAEQYSSATNTSNLRMELDADRHSDADILMPQPVPCWETRP